MDLLSTIPLAVYWVVLAITFMAAHVFAFDAGKTSARPGANTVLRIASSLVLLVGLVIVRPDEPGSILLALLAAAVGGFLSGRAAPPLRPAAKRPAAAEDHEAREAAGEGDTQA